MEYRETITEMATTEWRGIRLRVTFDVPQLKNTFSTQMVIDENILDILRDLEIPKEIKLLFDSNPDMGHMELAHWQTRNDKAKRLLNQVSGYLANEICHAIGKGLNAKS